MCSLEQENPYVHGKDRHVADVLSRLSIPSPDYDGIHGPSKYNIHKQNPLECCIE